MHVYASFFIFTSITAYHKTLNTAPWAIHRNLVYPSYIWYFASANPKLPIHPSLTSSWQTQICFLCPVSHWILTKHWRDPLQGLEQMRKQRPRKAERPSWDQRIMQQLAVSYRWAFDLPKSSSEHMWTQNNHETIYPLQSELDLFHSHPSKKTTLWVTVSCLFPCPQLGFDMSAPLGNEEPQPGPHLLLPSRDGRTARRGHCRLCTCRAFVSWSASSTATAPFRIASKFLRHRAEWCPKFVLFFSIIISPPNYHPVRSESSL